jgi:hypothetical protein
VVHGLSDDELRRLQPVKRTAGWHTIAKYVERLLTEGGS